MSVGDLHKMALDQIGQQATKTANELVDENNPLVTARGIAGSDTHCAKVSNWYDFCDFGGISDPLAVNAFRYFKFLGKYRCSHAGRQRQER